MRFYEIFLHFDMLDTLESGIQEVGQGINVGSGKFGKNDKRRARKIWPILTPKSIV